MNQPAEPLTLYQDWQARRERLQQHPPPGQEGTARAQIHILEYLLEYYRDAPIAAQPARFPLPPAGLILHRRTLVVHHHLARRHFKDSEERPEQRASRILQRISAVDPQSSLGPPAQGAWFGETGDLENARQSLLGFVQAIGSIGDHSLPNTISKGKAYFHGLDPASQIRLVNALLLGLRLPPGKGPRAVWGSRRILENQEVAEILIACNDPVVLELTHLGWRDLLAQEGRSSAARQLEFILRAPGYKERCVELLRSDLADADSTVRTYAAVLLASLGSVHEVGLLSDLLSLPLQGDEGSGERAALLSVMRTLSSAPA